MPNVAWRKFYRTAEEAGYTLKLPDMNERATIRDMIRDMYGLNPKENPLRGLHIMKKNGEYLGPDFFRDEQRLNDIKTELLELAARAVEGRERIGYDVNHHHLTQFEIVARRMLDPNLAASGTIAFIDPLQYDRLAVRFWRKVK